MLGICKVSDVLQGSEIEISENKLHFRCPDSPNDFYIVVDVILLIRLTPQTWIRSICELGQPSLTITDIGRKVNRADKSYKDMVFLRQGLDGRMQPVNRILQSVITKLEQQMANMTASTNQALKIQLLGVRNESKNGQKMFLAKKKDNANKIKELRAFNDREDRSM